MAGETTVGRAVARCLATLGDLHPSTARAYRWALSDLAATRGDDQLADVLGGPALGLWLASPTAAGKEPSPASVRQRATAARGLVRFALDHRLLDAPTAESAVRTLRRPATPAVTRDTSAARLLLARAVGGRPYGVSHDVWVRFRAHALLLAETGAPERDLGRALLAEVAPDRSALTLAGARYAVGEPTRHALGAWLVAREELVGTLQGSPPPQLWVRAHPSTHPRTGVVAPVGMPITARGLRKAFQEVVDVLSGADPRLATCTVAHVRALARPATA
ncbi:hypothetical protein J1G42_07830 [Cellulomonas sp. zg-ZUI222]|uniref:hypothetical protein n=1 Tax=Cellulomonas wangleii TaxID=2816956 RepID=UPI001A93AC12|nr:hypothetical protein [Cellulomonas wangleii]MBO0920734.1 hypothetical protein [Cellulomonas wangleii]